MKYVLWAIALFCLANPVSAKSWYDNLLDDLATVGDINSLKNDSDMQMSVNIGYPKWMVGDATKTILKATTWGLEESTETDEEYFYQSRWHVKSLGALQSMAIGAEQVRSRLLVRLVDDGPLTKAVFYGRVQFQKSRGWEDTSVRQIRDEIRPMIAYVTLASRFSGNRPRANVVVMDYKENKKRHGKKEYSIPDPIVASAPEPKPEPRSTTQPVPAPTSTADELLKLKSLLDSGALTQDEFDAEKRKLLGQ